MIGRIWKICRIPTAVLIALLPLIWKIFSGDLGFAHPESSIFLVHYNSDAPWLKLIFDPVRTDWGFYQARELSYIADMLDARFIAWSIKCHTAHFLSLSSIIFFALTIFIQQYFTAKCFPKLKWFIALLPSLVFSLAGASSNYSFFRSSKPAITFLATLLLFTVVDLVQNHEIFKKEKKVSLILAASALILMPLFDRQGFFFTGVFTAVVLLLSAAAVWKKSAGLLDFPETMTDMLLYLGGIGVVSLAFSTCWNIFIAPEIIMLQNGYYPSFEFQHQPLSACFNFAGGTEFFFRNAGFLFFPFFPGCSGVIGAVVAAVLAGTVFFAEYRQHRKPLLTMIFLLIILCGTVMGNLMTARHSVMLNDTVIYGTYFLPLLAVITGFAAVLLGKFTVKWNLPLIILCISAAVGGAALKIGMIQLRSESVDLMFFYKASAPRIIHYLNHPEIRKKMPLTLSNSFMVDFFRSRQSGKKN